MLTTVSLIPYYLVYFEKKSRIITKLNWAGCQLGTTIYPDASGLSIVMSIIRILKANNYQGTYAIEAHAYAGEEGGLLGSDAVAKAYKDQGKEVRGMLEFEMVGESLVGLGSNL